MNLDGNCLNLPDQYRRQVERVFPLLVPYAEVWAYGSRVSGTNRHGSDLDVVLRGPGLEPIPVNDLQLLRAVFGESNIPIIIDLHDWAKVPESFHREIERCYIPLVAPDQECLWSWAERITEIRAKVVEKTPERLDRFDELTSLRTLLLDCVESVQSTILDYDPDDPHPESLYGDTTIEDTMELLRTLPTSPPKGKNPRQASSCRGSWSQGISSSMLGHAAVVPDALFRNSTSCAVRIKVALSSPTLVFQTCTPTCEPLRRSCRVHSDRGGLWEFSREKIGRKAQTGA